MTELANDLSTRRREIVHAVADLSAQHGLPMPDTITVDSLVHIDPSKTSLRLDLDRNDTDGLQRWVDVLGLGEISTSRIGKGKYATKEFDSLAAESWEHSDGPLWLGLGRIQVKTFCDVAEGGDR